MDEDEDNIVAALRRGEDGWEYAAADEIEALRAELDILKGDMPARAAILKLAEQNTEIEALRAENARLRAALKDLIEDHEYMTDTDAEEDNMARAAARVALKETGDE